MKTLDVNGNSYLSGLSWFAGEFKNNRALKDIIASCPDITTPFGVANKINASLYSVGIINGGSNGRSKYYSLASELFYCLKKSNNIDHPVIALTISGNDIFLCAYTSNGLIKVDLSFDRNGLGIMDMQKKLVTLLSELSIISNTVDVFVCYAGDNSGFKDVLVVVENQAKAIDLNISVETVLLSSVLVKRKKSKHLSEVKTLSSLVSSSKKTESLIYATGAVIFGLYFGYDHIFPEKEVAEIPIAVKKMPYQVDDQIDVAVTDTDNSALPSNDKLKTEEQQYLDSELQFERDYLANMQYSNPLFNFISIVNKIKSIKVEDATWIVGKDVKVSQRDRQESPSVIYYDFSYERFASEPDNQESIKQLRSAYPEIMFNNSKSSAMTQFTVKSNSAYKSSDGTGMDDWRKRSNISMDDLQSTLASMKKNEIIDDFAVNVSPLVRKNKIKQLKATTYKSYNGWLLSNFKIMVDIKARYLTDANRFHDFFKRYPNFNLSEVIYNVDNNDLIIRGEHHVIN